MHHRSMFKVNIALGHLNSNMSLVVISASSTPLWHGTIPTFPLFTYYIICFFPWPVASVPTNVMAVQEGATSVRVSWTPSTSNVNGYIIFYTGGSNDSVTVSGSLTNQQLLSGLKNGEMYTISIVATSPDLPSDAIETEVTLGEMQVVTLINILY